MTSDSESVNGEAMLYNFAKNKASTTTVNSE